MKSSAVRVLLAFLVLPAGAFAANNVVNMSHYDLMRPDFVAMANGTNTNKRAGRQFHMSEGCHGLLSASASQSGRSAAVRVWECLSPSLANKHLRSL